MSSSLPDYSTFVRVTDLDTGHKVSIPASAVPHGNYRDLKADALDANGDPLPPEYAAPKSLSSNPNSGQQAEKKEKADG